MAGEDGEATTPMTQKLKQDDVDRILEMDSMRGTTFYRDPDRPDAAFVKSRSRVPEEVRRAQGRLRTARWRADMDRRKAPTALQIGMAMAVALATTNRQSDLTASWCRPRSII